MNRPEWFGWSFLGFFALLVVGGIALTAAVATLEWLVP